MSNEIKTVRVATDAPDNLDGFFVMNESDFDPAVHKLYGESASKPSDGLKVDEIKAALEAKGVAIPEGVTLKADLAALLDAA